MSCHKIKRLISCYIDKELADKKTVTFIEEHLSICPDCKAELSSLNLMKQFISDKQRLNISDDFLERLKHKLRPEVVIHRPKWVVETGDLAKRLIPVPIVTMILVITLFFGRLNGMTPTDEYIFSELSNEEIGVALGHYDPLDLLAESMFNG